MDLRDHAWNYFVLHSEQRLRTFHFYLILSTLLAGAVVTIAKDGNNLFAASVLSLLIPFLSFIFWKLDKRNKQLIKHAEEAIKIIERDLDLVDKGKEPHRLKLFLHEEYATGKLKRIPHTWPWSAHFSYSTCLNAVFLIFGLAGFIACFVLMLL